LVTSQRFKTYLNLSYYKSKILILIGKRKALEIPCLKLFDLIYVIDQNFKSRT